jgi:MFS family permease
VLRLTPGQQEHWVALRALLSVGAPLLTLWAIDRIDLAPFAVFPAFATVFGRRHEHRRRIRLQSVVAVTLVASVMLGALVPALGAGAWTVVAGATALVLVMSPIGDLARWTPIGPMFQVFAFVTLATAPVSVDDLVGGALTAAATAAWALALGVVWMLLRRAAQARGVAEPPRAPVGPRPSARELGSNAAIYGVAVAIAGAVPTLMGVGHVGWAMVAAVAGLAAPTVFHRVLRATHRLLGTLAGLAVAAPLVLLQPDGIWTVILVILLTGATELVVTRNYSLAMIPITPLVVLMGHLMNPASSAAHTLLDRLIETLIGIAVAIAVAFAVDAIGRGRRPHRG